MSRASWSWKDVAPAAPASGEITKVTVRVDPATYAGLLALARASGVSVNALAASLLKAVVDDDASAHAQGDA
ncbi:MAG: hypothetical protein AB1698_20925 [Pseudomonadota bacterium]